MIFWPLCLAAFLLWDDGSWFGLFGYCLLFALLLAYCVVIASLGLAIATWVSRLGRAVAICVSIVVGLSVGWTFLIMSLFSPDHVGIPLIMASPLYGTAAAASTVTPSNHVIGGEWKYSVAGAILWTFIHSSTAVALFALTLVTFDRCIGRMRESSIRSAARRPKKWSPDFDSDPDADLFAESATAEPVESAHDWPATSQAPEARHGL